MARRAPRSVVVVRLFVTFFVCLFATAGLHAQALVKSAIQVDPGNTKQTGATFAYRLTYNCSSTSGPCLNAEVTDLLPPEVQYVATVPASPTGDVAAIQVTPNFGGSGRTRVRFVMITPLPAGNSGDLLINVRFPNGSTPDGTQAINTADGINLATPPGTLTTPPVTVTAVASVQVNLQKTLQTTPANLDLPESYRLRISVPNNNGAVALTGIGPVVDTLPAGTVFNGATPTADCQPGCVGTTPATITWSAPCTTPLNPNQNCDITVNVTFPSATFPSGTNVTNSFTAEATPLGEPPQTFGPGSVTHAVTTFVPSPGAGFTKNMAGGTPNPPTLNQTFSYDFNVTNNGNVPLDNLVNIDTLPVQFQTLSVTAGAYNGLADFAAGEGVRVSYEKNTALGVFTLWGSSANTTTNVTLTAPPPGLGAGEYITRIRWEYGQAQPGMSPSTRPIVTGRIINPDNAGSPVAIGNSIQNCGALSAVYTAGPTNVNRNDCETFTLSGPFVQLNPAKENLSGGGPFNPGQNVSFRLRVRSAAQSSDPVPLENLIATDLLPVNLTFVAWTFDDRSTGLPAPQTFEQIPNYAGTGRTLLRWRWNAGSGSLGVNQDVWINITTTIRNGAPSGSLSNDFTLDSDAPSLGQRCSTSSQADALDLDADGDSAESLCRATGTITVAGIAQLISSKTIRGTCDGGAVSSSAGTLTGGAIEYHLRVQNVGTVAMQDFVLIDILPFVGDTGVRDTNPRGSQWSPLLAAPILPPSGTTIYYSTSGNPCRGEVGGPTTSCDPPNWTTVAPEPITSVRSFKIEFGDRVVNPFDFLEFTFLMTTPGNVPAGQSAYNSFAYQANRADGLGALAAEPQKVGITLGSCDAASLGDFVWVDLDEDGIQNDGPTGRNGVPVTLFTPGVDGVADTLDDVPLASAITSNGPDSAPGWYTFPGLAPGNYFVRITRPPLFELTARDTTTDANDSDANALGSSPVVSLAVNENNPTLDFGLVPTALAALGDYVWFDRDSDGAQNEPVTDGVNGVTVHLYLDDGDGTAEPGTGDVLMATTVTADDTYERPGYYLFESLVPGLPYFVQFVLPASATGFTTPLAAGSAEDSDANSGSGTTAIVTLAGEEVNRTLDAGLLAPSGTLALGDQVWLDSDDDGIFEPENGESGIDDVRLDLYADANGDGRPTLDEFAASTVTATASGFAGRYRFDDLAPRNYIVVVAPSSFTGGGALAGLVTSTGNDPAPDPDDDSNGDDNGTDVGALTASHAVTLSDNGEPTSEDGNNDTNLTVDFGFTSGASATTPLFDYGDAPDVGTGPATANYNTTALDDGPHHLLGVPNAPYLGPCVDDDGGFHQNLAANADDLAAGGNATGTCTDGDDEDGVTFSGSLTPGANATFNVTAGGPTQCRVDAWIDWNQNGVFGDSGELIAASLTVPTGAPTPLNVSVPATAIPGRTYARFRCSSTGGLPPIGLGADGEVEDYAVTVIGTDLGDAPASYGSASAQVDPLQPRLLGTCVDTEAAALASANAGGDDAAAGTSRIGSCIDDEDGITFTSTMATCLTASVNVTASVSSLLDAWIDFNGNGVFGDAGEQIFTNQALNAGPNALSYVVPCTATSGTTFSRFRISASGNTTPTSTSGPGEVEDYLVAIGATDFGDAPDSYGTLLASNGPHHVVAAGFSLGATVDSESAGQPSADANGDGADEDGVTIPPTLVACSSTNLTITLTNTAGVNTPRLDAWIDFDANGIFDASDRIATSLPLVAGANNLPVNVPCSARTAATYGRFRLTSTGAASPLGAASDGEVEDYAVATHGLDFGDAADPSYPTLLASNGARHIVLLTNNPTLGATVDTEANGQPTANATGDGADEDGVTFTTPLVPSVTGSVQIHTGVAGGIVNLWIDFNQNGSWNDAGEHVIAEQSMGANTSQAFPVAVPADAPQGTAVVRARISSQTGLGVNGLANDGEIEDHTVAILAAAPRIGAALRVVSNEYTGNCGVYDVTLELLLRNDGNVTLSNVQSVLPLASVFVAPATYSITSVTSATLPVDATFNGGSNQNLLLAGATLTPGQSATITIVIHLDATCTSVTYNVTTTATGQPPAGPAVTDVSQNGGDTDTDDDNDSTDDNEPTPIVITAVSTIPTVSEWALLAIAAMLALIALRRLT
ncbi:MAG TPA: GEVED domain-containing protein [Thermoanaerobaculia bacterium]|nr:GEVED domain-containing protein [Thermoanaerobaculia bacterium]